MSLKYYFSFRSPYSWIASKQLFAAPLKGIEVELIPFWEPDARSQRLLAEQGGSFLYQPMSEAKHRYILQDVRRITQRLGYSMKWPVDVAPWWDLAHLAYLKAHDLGHGMAFFWAVYRARWEQGWDISEPETIRAICEELGLPPEAVVKAPEDRAIRALGAACLYRIYCDEVFGVPFFIFQREKFWGIDRLPLLLSKLAGNEVCAYDSVARPPPAPAVYEFDHAGGCG